MQYGGLVLGCLLYVVANLFCSGVNQLLNNLSPRVFLTLKFKNNDIQFLKVVILPFNPKPDLLLTGFNTAKEDLIRRIYNKHAVVI